MILTIAGHNHTAYLQEGSLTVRTFGALRSSFSAKLSFSDIPNALPLVGQEITVTDGGKTLWGGILIETEIEIHSPKLATVTLRGEGYEHLLQRFCLPAMDLPDTTPSNAAIYIFETYFPKSDGLALGTVAAGQSIGTEYHFSPAKASAIMDFLAKENGYIWWVDKNKAFHMGPTLPQNPLSRGIDLTKTSASSLTDLQTLTFFSSTAGYRNVQYVYHKTENILAKAFRTDEVAKMQKRYGCGQYGAAGYSSALQSEEDARLLAQQLLSTAPGTDEIRFTTDSDAFAPGIIFPVTAPICGIDSPTNFHVTETKATYFAHRFRYTVTAKQGGESSPKEERWEQLLASRSQTETR